MAAIAHDTAYKVAAVQAAPAFLDLEAGVERAIGLIGEAAAAGARLIAFPECWIPGYPWWVWLDAPAWGMQFVPRYHENSMTANGPEAARIAEAARDNAVFVVLGYSERYHGSLYIGQLLIDEEGEIVAARRKLKPTHVERTVYGEGDGSDLKVHETRLGRLGALCCWEHLNPLNKYAMYAQDEQVHVGAWPSFSLYEEAAYALGPELNSAASQMYAAEGQCFVVAPCGVVSEEMIELLCDTPAKKELLRPGGGAARIFGPDGRPLAEWLAPDAEGLLFADVDLAAIAIAKSAADPTGHYARPDVHRLLFNPNPQPRVERLGRRGAAGRDSDALFETPEDGGEADGESDRGGEFVVV